MRTVGLWLVLCSSAYAGDGFDHSHMAFGLFLGQSVSNAGVKYDELQGRRAQLTPYLSMISDAPVSEFSRSQKVALWVNAYNALTLALILDEKQPKSIMELDGGKVWDTRRFKVAGQMLTLNDIEHKRARPLTDGRVHGAMNCASKGCPPLGPSPFVGSTLEEQLDEAARRWVATNAFVVRKDGLAVSQIFDWFADDFKKWRTGDAASLGAKEAGAVQFIRSYGGDIGDVKTVIYNDYDWALNSR